MKIYRLTKEGKRVAKVPGPNRDEILDYLYEWKTATLDELLIVDKGAKDRLREFTRKGYAEELDGV